MYQSHNDSLAVYIDKKGIEKTEGKIMNSIYQGLFFYTVIIPNY